MESVETLIVGAGPTGLGCAWRLTGRGQTDWLLCEARDAAGGLAGSVLDERGFTWDLGSHIQFSHYPYFDDLMDELLGVDGWWLHERESWIWIRDRFIPYPLQMNIRHLPDDERWQCVRGLIRASRPSVDSTPPPHFDAWLLRAFGDGLADVFLRPYNAKVWAHPLTDMSSGWIGDRVAVVDLRSVVETLCAGHDDATWGPNRFFRYPREGGTGAIWRELAARLHAQSPGAIRLGRRLVRVETGARLAHFDTGEAVHYERLCSTVPLDALVAMSDFTDTLVDAAGRLRHSSTHVVGVGLSGQPSAALRRKLWMYFPESDCPFYRVQVSSNLAPSNVPDAATSWSLLTEVAESASKPVDARRVVESVIDGLLATKLIATPGQVTHTWARRLEYGYPTPARGRDAALEALRDPLESRGIYSRGRFGAWRYEVSNQDHSFAQGVELVDRWLDGAVEETLLHPDVVNARRPTPRQGLRIGAHAGP